MDSAPSNRTHEPRITIFHCEHCCGSAPLWPAGAEVSLVRRPGCAAEVGSTAIREAFAAGADGVMILGCLGSACQVPLNELAELRRIHDGTLTLHHLGLAPARLQRLWLAPREASRVPQLVAAFGHRVAALGPRWQTTDAVGGAGARPEMPAVVCSVARA